jgi:hypothetical protein
MEGKFNKNESTYLKWLMIVSLGSGVAGWIVQGVLSEGFVYWTLPLFWIGTAIFTMNGDTIIESIVLLAILGVLAFIIGRTDAVVAIAGVGTIPGVYVALALSKILFALAKDGVFGN